MAISDPGGSLARPLEVVPSDRLTEYLGRLLSEEGVAEVLVGLPKTLKGEVGFQAVRVLTKLDVLKDMFPAVCFVEWDERLTTRLARASQSGFRSKGRSSRRKGRTKERVDHLAAASMLQEYLDQKERLEAPRNL